MKKFLALIMAAMMVCTLASCGKDESNNDSGTNNSEVSKVEENTPVAESALALLNKVWDSYTEDEKFPAAGGDFSEENANMEGPGNYSIEDATALDSTLGYPEASIDKIDSAASLMHMMNANTFTCGAYHVKNADDVSAVDEAIKSNILTRQWVCGFPEKLVIINVGDYVVAAFGMADNIDTFKNKITSAYGSAVVYCEENIE